MTVVPNLLSHVPQESFIYFPNAHTSRELPIIYNVLYSVSIERTVILIIKQIYSQMQTIYCKTSIKSTFL